MTTNAIPTSLLVPWIVTLHVAPSSVDGLETAIWAFEMVTANLRPQPTWLIRWPATESGAHRVQHTLGNFSSCRGADGAVHGVGFALLEGCGGGIDSPAFGVFGFPWCQVHSPSSPLFFFSDPSTSVFGSL
jgi:hypothetical protein